MVNSKLIAFCHVGLRLQAAYTFVVLLRRGHVVLHARVGGLVFPSALSTKGLPLGLHALIVPMSILAHRLILVVDGLRGAMWLCLIPAHFDRRSALRQLFGDVSVTFALIGSEDPESPRKKDSWGSSQASRRQSPSATRGQTLGPRTSPTFCSSTPMVAWLLS